MLMDFNKKMQLEIFKFITAGVILITTFIGSACPLFIKAKKWTARLESMAGGVFLGAGLAHLLADSFEELDEYMEDTNKDIDYPIGPALALAMFVILTLVELFSYSEHDANVFGDDCHHHHHDEGHVPLINNHTSSLTLQTSNQLLNSDPLFTNNNDVPEEKPPQSAVSFGSKLKCLTGATISLYVIMDIHSAIEGMALGILSTWGQTIAVFCAIVGHKPVEAFALSLILFKDEPHKFLFWGLVILYVLMSPIALIVGVYVSEISNHLIISIIAAISAGTFLFVGCHEWSEMFEHKHSWPTSEKLWHFGLFTLGVVWMLLIAIVETLGE